MKRIFPTSRRFKATAVIGLLAAGLLTGFQPLPAQGQAPAPFLLGMTFWLNLNQPAAMERAEQALTDAGLTVAKGDPVMRKWHLLGQASGLTVSIRCVSDDHQGSLVNNAATRVLIAIDVTGVAGTEKRANELRDSLGDYMKNGKPALTPPPDSTPPNATPISWKGSARLLRGKNGQRFAFQIPANGTLETVWGSDIYTDDSSIGTAALHAGVITHEQGGTVTIEIRAGQNSYASSTRNGVTSRSYGAWSGSFVVVGRGATNPPSTAATARAINWDTAPREHRGKLNQRFSYQCPPNGTLGSVWGTDVYTDDSSIGTAAVHAGLISRETGGFVTIEIRPGQESYAGSTRRGVTSRSWGAFGGSFVFVGGTGTLPAVTARDGICDVPRTLLIMDEWLAKAKPPQMTGENLRYEPWGRVVGESTTASIRVSGPPDTTLSRCEWLWQHAANMRSTNDLGTLKEYVEKRLN